MAMSWCAAAAALALGAATLIDAQTLADTARETAAKREGKPHAKITNKDLPTLDRFELELRQFVLTDESFWRYVGVRRLLLDVRLRHAATDQALLEAEQDAQNPLAVEAALTASTPALAVLGVENMSAREYVLAERAYRRAATDAALPEDALLRLPNVRAANARYLKHQDAQMQDMLELQWRQKEQMLEVARRIRQ